MVTIDLTMLWSRGPAREYLSILDRTGCDHMGKEIRCDMRSRALAVIRDKPTREGDNRPKSKSSPIPNQMNELGGISGVGRIGDTKCDSILRED
jgi:hypothetical protein